MVYSHVPVGTIMEGAWSSESMRFLQSQELFMMYREMMRFALTSVEVLGGFLIDIAQSHQNGYLTHDHFNQLIGLTPADFS